MWKYLFCVALIATAPALDAQPAATPAIVPLPTTLTVGKGAFVLTQTTAIVTDAASQRLGRQLASLLGPATGFDLPVRAGKASASGIDLRLQPSLRAKLGDEGYRLNVTARGVAIRAAAPAGVFYGMQTLRQLLPVDTFREATTSGVSWRIPVVEIEDVPRFQWRGAHLDVSRHFLPKEFVKKYIDLLALHKLNRFHWHLTDDQGWRLQIARYPKLTSVAAWRSETLIGRDVDDPRQSLTRQFDGIRYGGFYTQADAREIVAYAADRFVTVMPEIEMPGHSQAVVSAYPELGSTDEPVQPRTSWGVSPYLLNPTDATIQFMKNVLDEVLAIFPSPWIHVGGDEAVKTQWKNNPAIQARMQALGLKDENELQSWFVRQIGAYLTSKKRRLVGWDEILDGGLAENATVMSWRGINGAVAAARAGHDAVLAPTSNTYFDYYQSRDTTKEPLAIGGFLPLDRVYNWEPMPADIEPQFQQHILGVQGQLWTEYIATPKQAEYMAFPRLIALAEVAWTPTAQRRFDDFLRRLDTHLQRLAILDVNYRPLDR